MKFCSRDYSSNSPIRLLHRRSPIDRAIAFFNHRPINRAPTWLAFLLLACIPPAHAGSLGRLFFTPEQRAQLDYTYARTATSEGGTSPVLTVNGIVQKNGGARTVWVNGVAQSAANSRERTPTAQTVAVPGSHPVKLKVGEKILLDHPVPTDQNAAGN